MQVGGLAEINFFLGVTERVNVCARSPSRVHSPPPVKCFWDTAVNQSKVVTKDE